MKRSDILASITEFFKRMFVSGKTIRTDNFNKDEDTYLLYQDISLHEYGICTVVDYIATLIQQTQWNTYRNGKRFKGHEWYTWNVRPNTNQSAAEFWHDLTAQMLFWGEVVVFEHGGERFVSDNPISIDEGNGVEPYKYTNVGRLNYRKPRPLMPDEVLHFKYDNSRTRAAVAGLCDMYSKIVKSASDDYQKSSGSKGVLHIDTHQGGTDAERAAEMKLLQERFQAFYKAKNAVLPLKKGFEYANISSGNANGRDEISDITSLRADALKMACEAFRLPYGLISGEVAGTSDAWELCTATVLNPIKQVYETEMNGKIYTASDIIGGSRIKGDVSMIKPVNIIEKADNIYKLIGCGYTHNEIRERTGDDLADDSIANERFFTKNNEIMKGGGQNAE